MRVYRCARSFPIMRPAAAHMRERVRQEARFDEIYAGKRCQYICWLPRCREEMLSYGAMRHADAFSRHAADYDCLRHATLLPRYDADDDFSFRCRHASPRHAAEDIIFATPL